MISACRTNHWARRLETRDSDFEASYRLRIVREFILSVLILQAETDSLDSALDLRYPMIIRDIIENAKHIELACSDLPNFHLPIFVDNQSNVVRSYAESGFSTVVELPLRDEESLESVHREIRRLQNQRDPILLFLNRVASLIVRTIDKSDQSESELEFTRLEENLEANEQKLSHVSLDHVGQFLVARQSIAEETMKNAIEIGISNGDLNKYWKKWTGDGEVAVAVRLDSDIESPKLYTFLPMGKQATAPFSGYLHGSFSPSSNRESLDARIRLNTVLLTKGRHTCGKDDSSHHY